MDRAKRILILSCFGIALAWLPWFNYSAVLPIIQRTYGLTSSQSGTILGVFQLGYVISVLITGWMGDRIEKKIILVASSILIGGASLGFALFARDFNSILLWRVLVGMGCGGIYAPGLAYLSRWFPREKRGTAFGAYTGASVTAYAGGYLVAAPIGAAMGWESGIIATSLPVFIAAIMFSSLPKEPKNPRNPHLGGLEMRKMSLLPLALLVVAYMAHMWEQFAFWGWSGLFFTTAGILQGMASKEAMALGGILAASTVLMGTFAPWIGGAASDRFGRTLTAFLFSIFSVLFSFGIGWLMGSGMKIIIAAGLIYGFLVVADSAIYKAGLSEIIPGKHLSLGLAVQSALGFGAAIFSPKIFGMILDLTNTAGQIQGVWGWAFMSLGLGGMFSPVSFIFLYYLRKKGTKG
jgi:MFS family permease